MRNFDFYNPTRIVFGKGRIADLSKLVPSGAKVLVTYGGGSIKKNGTYDEVLEALKDYTVLEFGGIEPNPTYETLMQAVEVVRKEGITFLLAVGGGSVIDGTKFIATAAHYEGDPWEILTTFGSKIGQVVPLGAVLTLPAAGSEMNMMAVISRKETQDKLAFGHPDCFPKFAVMDPSKTFTLPQRQVANGVVDTFVHVVEQYLTYPAGGHVQDRFAEGILKTVIEFGPKALEAPEDYDIRATLMWAATVALNGIISVGVPQDWATHGLGHEITALYGLDHGQTLAVVLPSMLTVRRDSKRAKLLQYGERVWGITEGSEDERIDAAIEKTREFFEAMGTPTRFKDYGVSAEAVDRLVAQLERHGATSIGENREVTLEVSRKVYSLSL